MTLKIHRSEEDILIKKCCRQDGQAQKVLYERYAATMLGTCCRYIKDIDQAEDVMIAGFVKVADSMMDQGIV